MDGINNRQRQPDGEAMPAEASAGLRLHEADEAELLAVPKVAEFPVVKPVRAPRKRAAKKAAKRGRKEAAAGTAEVERLDGSKGSGDDGDAAAFSEKGEAHGSAIMAGSADSNDLLDHPEGVAGMSSVPLPELPKDLARYGREEMIAFCIQALYSPPSAASLDNPLCELRMGRTGPYGIFPAKQVLLSRLAKMLGTDEEEKPETEASEETLRRVLSSLSEGKVLPDDADEI